MSASVMLLGQQAVAGIRLLGALGLLLVLAACQPTVFLMPTPTALSTGEIDPFARKGLQLLVDGSEPEVIRRVMEVEMDAKEHLDVQSAKVYEAMGGYSPTIGIIGAVMGLIHVMENLADPSKLGGGIATAFVATIYGVGLANLIFLPVANKLKSRVHANMQIQEMMVEGVISIAEGENPRNIETKLQGFVS